MKDDDKIVKYIIENVLGKYMYRYKTPDYYPVVVGGSTFHYCKPNYISIPISDIDIVFVTNDHDPSIMKIKAMEKSRMKFISDIINDDDLKLNNINLEIDWIYKRKPELKRIQTIKLVRLKYNDNVVFDISIQYPSINRFLGKYPIASKKQIVPYVENKGILWATCTYVKYEIVRILIHYHHMFKKNEIHHLRLKSYLKYIKKICILLNISKLHDIDIDINNIQDVFEQIQNNSKFKRIQKKLEKNIPDLTKEAIIYD